MDGSIAKPATLAAAAVRAYDASMREMRTPQLTRVRCEPLPDLLHLGRPVGLLVHEQVRRAR